MIEPVDLIEYAPQIVGGALVAASLFAMTPANPYKRGWLTTAGARRYGLTGGSVPLGTMGFFEKETITAPKESFILAIGPTGYGKTKNLIENIIFSDKDNSMVIFDLKGDLLLATAHARSLVGPVYVLDPSGGDTNFYNPYIDIPVGDIAMIKDFHSWIVPQAKTHPFYTPIAIELFSAAAMHVLHCVGHEKTMVGMHSLLTSEGWLKTLSSSPIEGVRQVASSLTGNVSKEITGSVLGLLGWLTYPSIRKIMSKSDFRFTDIQSADKPFTVYIRLSEQSKKTMMPFARAIIGMLTMTMMKSEKLSMSGAEKQRGVTIVIDEMKQLALPNIETFLSAGRSFGGRVVMASQLISEVRDLYGKVVEGNCTTLLFTRTHSPDEANYVSEILQKRTTRRETPSYMYSQVNPVRSVRVEEVEVPLMTPSEVKRIPKHKYLVGVVDGHPVCLKTIYSPTEFSDVRERPFHVEPHDELDNPWRQVTMDVQKPAYQARAKNVKVAK